MRIPFLSVSRKSDGLAAKQSPVTRRGLAGLAAAGLGASALPHLAGATEAPDPLELRVMLRGLVVSRPNDPVFRAVIDRQIQEIARILPVAPPLFAIYAAQGQSYTSFADAQTVSEITRAVLGAMISAQPVEFGYTDLNGDETQRRVLPLEVLFPRSGVQLLAHCELRGATRRFFLREMQGFRVTGGDFSGQRLQLIQAAARDLPETHFGPFEPEQVTGLPAAADYDPSATRPGA